MVRWTFIFMLLLLPGTLVFAQEEADELLPQEPVNYKLKLETFRYVKPVIERGDTMWCYLLPELWATTIRYYTKCRASTMEPCWPRP